MGSGSATDYRSNATGDSWSSFFPPPSRPYFDATANAWVLSRYRDVVAALHEPLLRQAAAQMSSEKVRADVSNPLSAFRIEPNLAQMDPIADRLAEALARKRPTDLVRKVIRPWCVSFATAVLRIESPDARRLARLAPYISGGDDNRGAIRRKIADVWAERIFKRTGQAGAKSIFLGISQTLVQFVANAWIALLENPAQAAILRDHPELAPRSVEELLRYAGPVHTLARQAAAPVQIGGLRIEKAERLLLLIGCANRDPDRHPNPGRLDVTRRSAGHLGLGSGEHTCVGAPLLRTISALVIQAFAERCSGLELVKPVLWRCGATLRSPRALLVVSRNT